ncbi:MAG: cytochrome o ubiquinol oxidase subunit I [Candidatus Microsaccharimonas sossegonensis]|uniref:Cytochrome o ubiquinol oxidase subunit I n=1 Tax=Candidatus Microsaccharimonas sossegonensis TaxID=2506948 RepID=A0A4Q0AIA8_9BACT|nr:MAG: cytochrome o ubiquinol oxidase subunit I [Candidatus Microsaccharimonas sossegonensis]
MLDFIFGRLKPSDFVQEPITAIAGYSMVGALILAIIGLTYFKKWRWLWRTWITTLDPKKIGIMYILVAIVMLLRGLADAVLLRAQQALDNAAGTLLTSNQFQQIFSAHGSIMIFFVAMGIIFGVFNLIIPLQIGARDVAFPFLNSVSFWLFVAGMILINAPLVVGQFSAAGWLAYPPLSELQYSPNSGVDYWIWSLQIAGIGSLLSGINFFVTILKMRAPGMTLMKMPIFVWSALASTGLIMFAFPILTATLGMLSLDRLMGMHFFTTTGGGNPMMYINLIWAWGHPEVYILVLPALGIFSEVVSTFSRKKIFGYTSMVIALLAIAILSFSVWVHHFFTMGTGADVNAFFGIMTMIIAIPTGVKVFNWIFTMYRGRVRFTTPMLWFMGFIVTFTLGGLAGVLMAVPAADFQLNNSLFLVAHFHTMIVGGVLFGAFAGFTYWFPKFTGFTLNERLGRYAFWNWIVGFLLAFVPLYILGFMGATRRLDSYDPSLGWQGLFIVAGIGVAIICVGVFFQLLQIGYSIKKRHENRVGNDPWNGRSLEWSIASPPPEYNYAVIPTVTQRDEFWEQKKKKHGSLIKPAYQDIWLPKNSGLGPIIGGFALLFGIAVIWYMWWLLVIGLIGVIVTVIIRLTSDDTERKLSAAAVAKYELKRGII